MQESCYFRGVRGLAPASSAASRLSSEASCSELHNSYVAPNTSISRLLRVSRARGGKSRHPTTPKGGGRKQGGGGRKALIAHIYITTPLSP